MGKLLVGDIRKLVKDVKQYDVVEFEGLDIKVRNYAPIKEKMEIALNIYVEATTLTEDDVLSINYSVREIATVCLVTEAYTNLTLPKDKFEAYDILKESRLDEVIFQSIDEREIGEINTMVDHYIARKQDEHAQESSIGKIVQKALSQFTGVLDGVDMQEVKETLEEKEKEINAIRE